MPNTTDSSSSSSSSTLPNPQACAACKHQRRRCTSQCTLAPYFPSNRMQDFLQVHRYFGVSKVNKNLESVKESDRLRTAECLIYEAKARSVDPVLGCVRTVRQLQNELSVCELQLKFVLRELELARVKAERKENTNPSNYGGGGGGFGGDYGNGVLGFSIIQDIKSDPYENLGTSCYLKEGFGGGGEEEGVDHKEVKKQNLD